MLKLLTSVFKIAVNSPALLHSSEKKTLRSIFYLSILYLGNSNNYQPKKDIYLSWCCQSFLKV